MRSLKGTPEDAHSSQAAPEEEGRHFRGQAEAEVEFPREGEERRSPPVRVFRQLLWLWRRGETYGTA